MHTAKSSVGVAKYAIIQNMVYVPIGPLNPINAFRIESNSMDVKLNINIDAATVVMMPLIKLAKLTFPS